MDIDQAIQTRKSIRAFRPDPVSKEMLREIIEVAVRCPSSGNSQPWEMVVAAGAVLKRIGDENVRRFSAGVKGRFEVPWSQPQGAFRERHTALGAELYRLMGIGREDREKRLQWVQWGLRYFGAPAVIFLTVDNSIEKAFAGFDLGLLSQSICLSALARGLGTCIELQGVAYPEVIREYAGIPDSKTIFISIAIGYPEWNHPANKIVTPREPLESFTTWRGFE